MYHLWVCHSPGTHTCNLTWPRRCLPFPDCGACSYEQSLTIFQTINTLDGPRKASRGLPEFSPSNIKHALHKSWEKLHNVVSINSCAPDCSYNHIVNNSSEQVVSQLQHNWVAPQYGCNLMKVKMSRYTIATICELTNLSKHKLNFGLWLSRNSLSTIDSIDMTRFSRTYLELHSGEYSPSLSRIHEHNHGMLAEHMCILCWNNPVSWNMHTWRFPAHPMNIYHCNYWLYKNNGLHMLPHLLIGILEWLASWYWSFTSSNDTSASLQSWDISS